MGGSFDGLSRKKANGDERKVQKQDLELIGEDVLFAFPLLSAP